MNTDSIIVDSIAQQYKNFLDQSTSISIIHKPIDTA